MMKPRASSPTRRLRPAHSLCPAHPPASPRCSRLLVRLPWPRTRTARWLSKGARCFGGCAAPFGWLSWHVPATHAPATTGSCKPPSTLRATAAATVTVIATTMLLPRRVRARRISCSSRVEL